MHGLTPIKDRDKPLVRIHPDIYEMVKDEAEKKGMGKTEALDKIVLLGIALSKALESIGEVA